jgi:hypothetical protein
MSNAYIQHIESTFNEWSSIGHCSEAVALNQKIGEEYFCTSNPHFFTGNFEAPLVLVHLNPKRDKNKITGHYKHELPNELKSPILDFDSYLNFYRNFGSIHYGKEKLDKHSSPFDHKQVRFLRPFGVLPFTDDVQQNLEIVIDQKLQLELIPYGSADFNSHKIGVDLLRPFLIRLFDALNHAHRDYIIFCGKVFEKILIPMSIKSKRHNFYLTKVDGTTTKSPFQLINLEVNFNGKQTCCAIAPQFAKQGYPVEAYGKKVFELYGKFE